MRGTTMIRDIEESDLKAQIRAEMVGKLAAEWNTLQRQMEHREYAREAYRDLEDDFHQEQLEEFLAEALDKVPANATKEERREARREAERQYWRDVQEQEERDMAPQIARLEVIEELLEELGSRMMRPYEHWNEDERYMEYMENRYESYDDY